jgi:hypothetical protein
MRFRVGALVLLFTSVAHAAFAQDLLVRSWTRWVSPSYHHILTVTNVTNGALVASHDLGATDSGSIGSLRLATTGDGLTVFAALRTQVARLQVDTNLLSFIDLGAIVTDIMVNPDGTRLYVATTEPAIHVLSTTTGAAVMPAWPLSVAAGRLAVTPDGAHVFALRIVSPAPHDLHIFAATTGTLVHTRQVAAGARELQLSPDGTVIYVAHSTFATQTGDGDSLSAHVWSTGQVLGTVTLPDNRTSSEYWPGPVIVYEGSQVGRMTISADGSRVYIPRTSVATQKGGAYSYSEVVDTINTTALTHVASTRLTPGSSFSPSPGAIGAATSSNNTRLHVVSSNAHWQYTLPAVTQASVESTAIPGPLGSGLRFVDLAVLPRPTCWFDTAPIDLRNAGGVVNLTVNAPDGCAWTATPSADWISVTPQSGTGPSSVTVIVGPTDRGRNGTITFNRIPAAVTQRVGYLIVDSPASPSLWRGQTVTIQGWALDDDGRADGSHGITRVEISDETPGQPVALLSSHRHNRYRPDVGAAFGERFEFAGFSVDLTSLSLGDHRLVVRAFSSGDATVFTKTLELTLQNPIVTRLGIDGVSANAAGQSFTVTGWAYYSESTGPCGISRVHLSATPVGGGTQIALGNAYPTIERPDAAATIGRTGSFPCGWSLTFPAPTPGAYAIYALATLATDPASPVTDAGLTADLTRGPFGIVDTPTAGSTVAGAINITGWALDEGSVTRVAVYLDDTGAWIGDATFVDGARPDVAAAFPTLPNNTRAGWGLQVLSNMLPGGGNGTTRFRIVAYDNLGTPTTLAVREVVANNATSTLPFGTIDVPSQGASVSGTVAIYGWALTPAPHIIPADGSTIEVLVDDVVVGRPFYSQCRGTNGTNTPAAGTCNDDIAQAFGLGYRNIAETSGAIGSFLLDTTTLTNGMHSLAWRVTDSNGATQGIGSRLIYVDNPTPLTAAHTRSPAR